MAVNRRASFNLPQTRWYRGTYVPLRVIRRFARQVAERFHPEKIILFGPDSGGTRQPDGEVDILVVRPPKKQIERGGRSDAALTPPFPLDLIVRTPKNVAWRLAAGDSFL